MNLPAKSRAPCNKAPVLFLCPSFALYGWDMMMFGRIKPNCIVNKRQYVNKPIHDTCIYFLHLESRPACVNVLERAIVI